MKKLSSFILTVMFFLVLILPSFVIPIDSNSAPPEKQKEIVYLNPQINVEALVSPTEVVLPEITITERVKPQKIIIEVPTYIKGDTVYLPMPYIDKIYADVQLLEEIKPVTLNTDLIKITQGPGILMATWP